MTKDEIIKALRDMAKYPTVTLPRDCEALRAAADLLAQPEQEPVAFTPPKKWRDSEIADGYRGIRWVTGDGVYGTPTQEDVVKYLGYTTPPQRKPLTDDQLDALALDDDGLPNSHFEFARAIEAAHGIGDKT